MQRIWIWLIPVLAALSAIWIQAALHGFETGLIAPRTAIQAGWRPATEAVPFPLGDHETVPPPPALSSETGP